MRTKDVFQSIEQFLLYKNLTKTFNINLIKTATICILHILQNIPPLLFHVIGRSGSSEYNG